LKTLIFLAAILPSLALAQALPVLNPSGPDAEAYGAADNYPVRFIGPSRIQKNLVGAFSHDDQLSRGNKVGKAAVAAPLARAAAEIALSYAYKGRTGTIPDYLSRHPATGLLILKDRTILAEHYQYGRTDQDRFVSQSMAKTVTSMLVGVAVAEGKIRSIDDLAESYVPALAGSAVGGTPIRALLHMASGIGFKEVYDGHDDAAALGAAMFPRGSAGAVQGVRMFNNRETPPDTHWHYKGLDTVTLGLVLTAATGMPMAEYFSSRIWSRIGTESDARWTVDANGQEVAMCCLSATVRDYARFGALLAHDGLWDGQQIIPADWVRAATSVQAPFLAPGHDAGYYGYGYQVWLLPGARRQFVLLGIHGQAIYVDPTAKLVLVHTAVRKLPSRDPEAAELGALWRALVAREG
jgi:CubicO group peptidase (beta-lactamase class C family)